MCHSISKMHNAQQGQGGCEMRWYQPNKQVPPAINPTDSNGDYRPEYVEWLKDQPVQDWDDIRNCLEAGVCDYAEWDGDKDGFIIRLYADKKDDGDGFRYIFSVTTNVYADDGSWWDVESADMPAEHWHPVHRIMCMNGVWMWRTVKVTGDGMKNGIAFSKEEAKAQAEQASQIRAEWDIPTIDGIDAERDIICEVVNMMWVIGLGNREMLCPIRYISQEGMDNIIASPVEKRRPYIGWGGHEYYEI